MTVLLSFLATLFLAYSNGANDNFKGVASLFGSRTTSYRTAIRWATLTTFAGSMMSVVLAQSLLTKFSGTGIVPDQIAASNQFFLAVAVSAALTVIVATIGGFPVSTTHALTGGIVGTGLAAVGTGVNLRALGRGFVLPLALSPVLAVTLAASVYIALRFVRLRLGMRKEWCLCVAGATQVVPMPQPGSAIALQAVVPAVAVFAGRWDECAERYAGRVMGLQLQSLVDAAHVASAGIVSFARGLNDTPKIAAMLLVAQALNVRSGVVAVAVAISIGGILSARRVAETMSLRITGMNRGQGLAANLSTGVLVILASVYGLPVSTTHVSVGSLCGIGLLARKADLRVVSGIVLSWVLTLPCAAILGGGIYWLFGRIGP